MAKKNKFTTKDLDKLYEIYDKARAVAQEAESDKKEAAEAIREKLGATEEASTPNYVVTYRYDKDKEVETFDQDAFETKDPKGHDKYVGLLDEAARLTEQAKSVAKKFIKVTTVKGTRKLVVTRQEAEE